MAVERMRIGPARSRLDHQSGALTRFGLSRLAIGVGSLCAALLTAAPLRAEPEILDGDAFRALAEGHTLWFEQGGRPFGVEQYLEGDRTLWRPEGGPCEEGIWFESNGTICFLYDNGLGPQCWIVTRRGGEIFARSVGDPDGLAELRMSDRSTETLGCPGPSLGV
ncbi:MAG: hypothetical protein AAGD12_11060 [Pseudomonadota bacterium]